MKKQQGCCKGRDEVGLGDEVSSGSSYPTPDPNYLEIKVKPQGADRCRSGRKCRALGRRVKADRRRDSQRWFLWPAHASCLSSNATPSPPSGSPLGRRDRLIRWPQEARGCKLWEAGRGGRALTGQSKEEGAFNRLAQRLLCGSESGCGSEQRPGTSLYFAAPNLRPCT